MYYRLGCADARASYGLEKQAILGSLLLGAGLHLGANSAYKAFKGTSAGHQFEAGQAATGFRHGLAGQNLNPIARNVGTFGLGPESLVNYDLGRQLGSESATMSTGARYRWLKKLRKNVAMTEHVREAPLGKAVVPAINRILSGQQGVMDKLPTVAAGTAPTLGQKITSVGLGAAAAAAEPHSLIHMGINATRNAVGRSRYGQQFMRDQLFNGARHGNLPAGAQALWDFGVSPAALDTRRLGSALSKEYTTNPALARRVGSALTGQALGLPRVRAGAEKLLSNMTQHLGSFLR